MQHFDQELEQLIKKQMLVTKGNQMSIEEYYYISSIIRNKNFLVFGTGYDSNIWRFCNQGITIFLEDNDRWIDDQSDVYKIQYTTKLTDADRLLLEYKNNIFKNLETKLPDVVTNTRWDVILIDAPAGNKPHFPGRMQSIYAAKKLAKDGCKVLIHDCDRHVEDTYSKEFFGKKYKEFTKLRSFEI